jgi:hypothetical protein
MMLLVLQKKAMVFLFAQVFSDEHHKLIRKVEDFLAGQPAAKNLYKLLSAAQTEKMGERTPVEFFGEAKADL